MANGTIAVSQLDILTQSGTGVITVVPPATNTDRTLTLPDDTGTVLTDQSSLNASKLTGALPAVDGSALTGITLPYQTGQVIEELHAVCNTTSLHGRATIQSVTGSQAIAESYGDATGSVVTSYTPPSSTKMIVYDYTAHLTWRDAHAISHWRLYYQIDGGTWTEVTNARTNRNGYYPEEKQILRWVFEVGAGSTTAADGIFSAATPQLGFKWQCRDYSAANERGYLHLTQYWDGGGTDVFSKPMIMVKAIA